MKIYTNKQGVVTAVATTMEDVEALLALRGGASKGPAKKRKKHKKHAHRKQCAWCPKECKGLKGLATHSRHCIGNPDNQP